MGHDIQMKARKTAERMNINFIPKTLSTTQAQKAQGLFSAVKGAQVNGKENISMAETVCFSLKISTICCQCFFRSAEGGRRGVCLLTI
jgi:hypothetical protein